MNLNNLILAINQKLDVTMTDEEIINYMEVTLVGKEIAVLPEEFHDQLVRFTINRIKIYSAPAE